MTGCLRRRPGPRSWNSLLTQVLGSGGRGKRKLGRRAGRRRRRKKKESKQDRGRQRETKRERERGRRKNGGMQGKAEASVV